MRARLTEEGFLQVDRVWSEARFKAYQAEIEAKRAHGYYQHIILCDREGKGIETPGHHQTTRALPLLDQAGFPLDFAGLSVLDIGCNAGFYSLAARLRGARRVLGLDHQPHYIAQAVMVRTMLELKERHVEFRVASDDDLPALGEAFDFVINTGVMYHLEDPMRFLRRATAVTRETMLIESEMLLDEAHTEHAWFIEGEYGEDPSNWWICGPECMVRMARAAGFRSAEFKGFIWKPEPGTLTPEGYPRQGRGVVLCRK